MTNLIEAIRQSVIGDHTTIRTPFGNKPLIYADYTASGRSLSFIEDFIRQQVLPYYANTHTETSFTGAQTTALREQARECIRQAVNGSDSDRVIFCGSGATAAIHKLIDILNLRLPADLNDRYQLDAHIPDEQRPVVFVGPYEHHSNELPWRESIADLVNIPLTADGQLDTIHLKHQLIKYQDRPLKIGSFSAASNVTGIKTDTHAVSRLLHKYHALSFWDYAAAAPYVGIDMSGKNDSIDMSGKNEGIDMSGNGDGIDMSGNHDDCDIQGNESQQDSSKDAVFISTHKFIGGPGTPGILIVKEKLLNNRVPAVPGGGTVDYVTPESHRYSDNRERREEGGTPAIIEAIRAGLVFKLQQDVGTREIEKREADFLQRATQRWQQNSNIKILGNTELPRLSISSLRISHQGRDLHYGFVVALLNDLFGIQARGGCSCAGPYGHSLLGMSMAYSKALDAQLRAGHMVLRPGWVRLNFNYFIDEATFEYLVRAIELVADHGWRLLPYYKFDECDGVWRYQHRKTQLPTHLQDMDPLAPPMPIEDANQTTASLRHCLQLAEMELLAQRRRAQTYDLHLPDAAESLRWFVLPQDIQASLP